MGGEKFFITLITGILGLVVTEKTIREPIYFAQLRDHQENTYLYKIIKSNPVKSFFL